MIKNTESFKYWGGIGDFFFSKFLSRGDSFSNVTKTKPNLFLLDPALEDVSF